MITDDFPRKQREIVRDQGDQPSASAMGRAMIGAAHRIVVTGRAAGTHGGRW